MIELGAPKHGIDFDERGKPKILNNQYNYGQSKCGNVFMATELAKQSKGKGNVVHLVRISLFAGSSHVVFFL